MELDAFTACLKIPGGIANVAQALASRLPAEADKELLLVLAGALSRPDSAFPDVPASGPLGTEYVRNLSALRQLVDWKSYRLRPQKARSHIISSVEQDCLAALRPVEDWGPAALLTHAALSLIRPRNQAAVVVTMRDDGISILEWIAHYRAIGFQAIFVYSNDNADGSDALLRKLADQGLITFIENQTSGMVSPQRKAFEHSLHFLPELRDYEWVFYADSDEFLVPAGEFDYSIPNVLSMMSAKYLFQAPSAICYHWRWFISNYAFARTDGLLLERFRHATSSKLFKSMVRIADAVSMRRLHFPDVARDKFFVDPNLNIILPSIGPDKEGMWDFRTDNYSGGQINHYWCKSFEEFALKKRRGDQLKIDKAHSAYKRDTELFFTWNDFEHPGNAAPPPARLLERVRTELETLRSGDGIEELQAGVNVGFNRLVASVAAGQNLSDAYEELAISTSIAKQTGQGLVADHHGTPYKEILAELHEVLRPSTYFEIGTDTGATLTLAMCESIAVDPAFNLQTNVLRGKTACHLFQMTSDDFFARYDPRQILGHPIDLAFLDGMHWFEYLLRDFTNTEPHCHRGSVIALHDCLPTDVYVGRREPHDRTKADRFPHPSWWAGDVWKVVLILKRCRPDLKISCLDAPPTGLVLVTALDPDSTLLRCKYDRLVSEYAALNLLEYSVARLFDEFDIQRSSTLWAQEQGIKRLVPTITA